MKKSRENYKKAFMHILGISAIIYGLALLLVLVLKIDGSTAVFFTSHQNEIVKNIMLVVSYLGTTSFLLIIFAIVVIMAFVQKKSLTKLGLLYAFSVVGTTAITYLMKLIIQRERPFNLIETGFSFPSGHSSASMAAYGVIAFLLWNNHKKLALFAFSVPLFIAFSRIYLNVHWISDVFAGLFLGAAVLFFLIGIIYKNKNDPLRRVQ